MVKSSGEGKDKVDVDIPVDEKDIDAAYEDAKHILAQKPPKEVKKEDASQKMEDDYKNIRYGYRALRIVKIADVIGLVERMWF